MLTGEPFLLIGNPLKTSKANWERDSGESSMTGISRRNLGCFVLLSLVVVSLVLLRGFSKVDERQALAWRMAASFEAGGAEEEEDKEQWIVMSGWDFLCLLGRVTEVNEKEEEESVLVSWDWLLKLRVWAVCVWILRRLEAISAKST